MHWDDIPDAIADWTEKIASVGFDVRTAAADVITASHVGHYCDPLTGRVGIYAPKASGSDAALVKAASLRATGEVPLFLTYQDLAAADATWVKVAHSPALRSAGEMLNFFPGQYPGGMPNSPSPVAAMLTAGLLGAGLGWGGGKLIGALMPGEYGKKLSRTGAVVGGLLGAAPGAVWGGTNRLAGKPFDDPSLLSPPAGGVPEYMPSAANGANALPEAEAAGDSEAVEAVRRNLERMPLHKIKLGAAYLSAVEKAADTFGSPYTPPGSLPTDVNIDAIGRTLWDCGASPGMAATTMSSLYAAQQLPDPRSRPGVVTGHQLGQLAGNAAGDYVRGYLVGAALNTAVGTPFRNSTFGAGNAALGIIGAVVPRLFGR